MVDGALCRFFLSLSGVIAITIESKPPHKINPEFLIATDCLKAFGINVAPQSRFSEIAV